MNKKYLPISISSNKILKILISPPINDSSIDFNNLFSKIKSEEEKNAIAFLTIGIGNIFYSGKATTYIMQKLNTDHPFQLKNIPKKEIQNFWRYMPSFVNINKALSHFFHLLVTFIPTYYDDIVLISLMNIKCENQILLSIYTESMQDFYDNYPVFLKKFLVDSFPTPLQIQNVIAILVKRDKTFGELLKLFETHKNTNARFSLEYSLIFYLSSFNGSIEMINNIPNLMMLFLDGSLDFKSQLFLSLCYFINKWLITLELPKTNEDFDDYPFYVLKRMKKQQTPTINTITKQCIQKIKNLSPISIYYLFAINNENLCKELTIQLTKLKDPLPIIEKLYKKGKSISNPNILNLLNHATCALFIQTPLEKGETHQYTIKQVAEYMKNITEIYHPIQFLSKISDMICTDDLRGLAFDLLKIDKSARAEIFLKLNEIVESDCPTNKIDGNFLDLMNSNPGLTIQVFIAFCSSIIYTSSKARKNRLISIVKRTILTYFNEKGISFDDLISSTPELEKEVNNPQELFDLMKKTCGQESDFHNLTDETFKKTLQKQSFIKKK